MVLLIGKMVEEYNVQKSKIIFWILSFFKIPTVSSSIFKPRIVYQMHGSLTVLHSTFVVPLLLLVGSAGATPQVWGSLP